MLGVVERGLLLKLSLIEGQRGLGLYVLLWFGGGRMFEGEMGLIVFGDGVGVVDGEVGVVLRNGVGSAVAVAVAAAAAAAGVDESGTAVVVEVAVLEMDAVEVAAAESI